MSSTQQLLLGEGAGGGIPNFIEEVFSTFLYTGNGSTQTVTNGIDLSTKGGMVWIKCRNTAYGNRVNDTVRGASKFLATNSDAAEDTNASVLTAFTSSGFSVGASTAVNENAATYASWTFREQPKFFDIVTYTGTGANRTIAHNLGSVPGSIIVKRTDTTADWAVYHRSLANTQYLVLNTTAAAATGATWWNSTTPTSSVFSLGTDASVNASGGTYVAYIFAHDAAGFGLTGTDNVISCGSFTADGSGNATINLGYEPQWVMYKCSSNAGNDWEMNDIMRGLSLSTWRVLWANLSNQESNYDAYIATQGITPNSTGFSLKSAGASRTFIYIAIRRGPMKVPTLGTTVFSPVARSGTGTTASTITAGFAPDLHIVEQRQAGGNGTFWRNKLVGMLLYNQTTSDREEFIPAADFTETFSNTGVSIPTGSNSNKFNYNGYDYINWMFGRAPGFMDIVCFDGSNSNFNITHNLGAVPELIITKRRSSSGAWFVFSSYYPAGFGTPSDNYFTRLNLTNALAGPGAFFSGTITSTTIPMEGGANYTPGQTGIAYLFATCAGVSKVGTYTGTGALQTVNCGFTTGVRFVFIKRTDSTGNWWVYDSDRGITAGNDPYLFLNAIDTEVTNTNYVDTDTTGFKVTAAAPAELNANGGTYLFLAIA
jgi:hypothetical protein